MRSFKKKGSLQEVIVIGAVLLFFGMCLLFGYKIMDAVNTEIQASDVIDADGKAASTALRAHYGGAMDYGFLLLAIGLGIATLILAALVRIHPVFIPLFFIGLVIVVFLCGIFSNIYQEMAGNSELTALADDLIFTSHILEYLPLIVGIFGILLMIVMYKLWSVNREY
jgi:hypothetical protein